MSLSAEGLNYYNGSEWIAVSTGGEPAEPFYIGRPTRKVEVSQSFSAPFLTYTTLEAYSAGEILWSRFGATDTVYGNVWIPTEDMPVGYTWQEDVTIPPPDRERPFTILKSSDDNVSVFSQVHGDEWYRNSISSGGGDYSNTVEIIREGIGGDYGSIVKVEAIPNNWYQLTLGAETTFHGNADIMYIGLLTDATKVNVTNENLYFTSGVFRYSDIWNNREGVRKTTNGVEDFNTFASDTQPDVGQIYNSSITLTRAAIDSETISITGGLNGDFYSFPATASVLPTTGESYFIIGGITGGASATLTANNPYYIVRTAE